MTTLALQPQSWYQNSRSDRSNYEKVIDQVGIEVARAITGYGMRKAKHFLKTVEETKGMLRSMGSTFKNEPNTPADFKRY